MKESEIPKLKDLKIEYESKLKDLKSEYEKAAMSSLKEAMVSKGIRLEPSEGINLERTRQPSDSMLGEAVFRGGVGVSEPTDECGICTHCITWCTVGCVLRA